MGRWRCLDSSPYPLVMISSSPWYRWPIEIDGLPFLKMVDLSMAMLSNQRVGFPFFLAEHVGKAMP